MGDYCKACTEKILYASSVAYLIIPRRMFNVLINHHFKTFLSLVIEGYYFVFKMDISPPRRCTEFMKLIVGCLGVNIQQV